MTIEVIISTALKLYGLCVLLAFLAVLGIGVGERINKKLEEK